MKSLLCLIGLLMVNCHSKHDRFIRTASAFPKGYVGHWEAILSSRGGPQVFQAGVTIQASGDSLLWGYFSQLVDTTTNRTIACGPEMDLMPIFWDDSIKVVQGDHGANQGYGFDIIRLVSQDRLQLNSPWLATSCRGPGGFNSSQLVFTKVNSFRYNP